MPPQVARRRHGIWGELLSVELANDMEEYGGLALKAADLTTSAASQTHVTSASAAQHAVSSSIAATAATKGHPAGKQQPTQEAGAQTKKRVSISGVMTLPNPAANGSGSIRGEGGEDSRKGGAGSGGDAKAFMQDAHHNALLQYMADMEGQAKRAGAAAGITSGAAAVTAAASAAAAAHRGISKQQPTPPPKSPQQPQHDKVVHDEGSSQELAGGHLPSSLLRAQSQTRFRVQASAFLTHVCMSPPCTTLFLNSLICGSQRHATMPYSYA